MTFKIEKKNKTPISVFNKSSLVLNNITDHWQAQGFNRMEAMSIFWYQTENANGKKIHHNRMWISSLLEYPFLSLNPASGSDWF